MPLAGTTQRPTKKYLYVLIFDLAGAPALRGKSFGPTGRRDDFRPISRFSL
jgi:hypothetical protein